MSDNAQNTTTTPETTEENKGLIGKILMICGSILSFLLTVCLIVFLYRYFTGYNDTPKDKVADAKPTNSTSLVDSKLMSKSSLKEETKSQQPGLSQLLGRSVSI